jgi:beta-alanine degradation protein BauB
MEKKMKPAIYVSAGVLAAALTTQLIVSQAGKAEQKAAQTPTPTQSQAPAQSQRIPQFDNSSVKVWKTVILPHQPLAMHHHDHPRVIVALTGGDVNIIDPSGAIEAHHWESGHAYWLPAMAPNTLHSDANAGENPIEVMVVELEKEQ